MLEGSLHLMHGLWRERPTLRQTACSGSGRRSEPEAITAIMLEGSLNLMCGLWRERPALNNPRRLGPTCWLVARSCCMDYRGSGTARRLYLLCLSLIYMLLTQRNAIGL